jgi:hypothetical protein
MAGGGDTLAAVEKYEITDKTIVHFNRWRRILGVLKAMSCQLWQFGTNGREISAAKTKPNYK